MLQSGEQPDLAEKTPGRNSRRDVGIENLYCHRTIVNDIARQEHCRHSAATDLAIDPISRADAACELLEKLRAPVHASEDGRSGPPRKRS